MSSVIAFLQQCDEKKIDGLAYLAANNIKVAAYPKRNLYILNYEQIEKNPNVFNKTSDINRECRNLVIRANPWQILSQSFKRFFNYGEDMTHTKIFDELMSKGLVTAGTKYDGSLISVAYFDDQWNIFTRGSLADDNHFRGTSLFQDNTDTFGCRVRKYLDFTQLDKSITYVFELCTPNMHVTKYKHEFLALLSVNRAGQELPIDGLLIDLPRPETFIPKSIDDVKDMLKTMPPDFEGYVLSCQTENGVLRMKVKQTSYVELHHMVTKYYTFADLVTIVITGEIAEVSAYLPQYADVLNQIKYTIELTIDELDEFYKLHHSKSRRDYAILACRHQFSWILFDMFTGKAISARASLYDTKNVQKVANTLEVLIKSRMSTKTTVDYDESIRKPSTPFEQHD